MENVLKAVLKAGSSLAPGNKQTVIAPITKVSERRKK
jgi:hypothetical protein